MKTNPDEIKRRGGTPLPGTPPAGRRALETHKRRLESFKGKMDYEHPKPRYNGRGEAEVVPGFQLSAILKRWIVEFMADWRSDAQFEMRSGLAQGPIDWLAQKTEISHRRVSGICNGEFEVVSLTQAEKLITAIGAVHVFRTGQLQIVPNPNWSTEKWIEYMKERGCA